MMLLQKVYVLLGVEPRVPCLQDRRFQQLSHSTPIVLNQNDSKLWSSTSLPPAVQEQSHSASSVLSVVLLMSVLSF